MGRGAWGSWLRTKGPCTFRDSVATKPGGWQADITEGVIHPVHVQLSVAAAVQDSVSMPQLIAT